ncbi:DUF960 family protein [Brevibacillus agri]|uniref:DUF960 family protein n=1 Tax=Brevibacillus agri TaxID=51101 RepID=UPI0018CDF5A1|nr:DUF960 family protein [Brevibacillus agri]MBG9564131.1 hypothetical protein [Brevibacillus agri]
MFENERYVTQGVTAEIPAYLQNLLWYLIETMEVKEKDYLQVFTLTSVWEDGELKQCIIHSQERPAYRKEYRIRANLPMAAKIFVIDDGDHTTMLLAEEY